MKTLQEKVEKMLQGERKRREVAEKFLADLTEQISEVCLALYGESGRGSKYDEPSPY